MCDFFFYNISNMKHTFHKHSAQRKWFPFIEDLLSWISFYFSVFHLLFICNSFKTTMCQMCVITIVWQTHKEFFPSPTIPLTCMKSWSMFKLVLVLRPDIFSVWFRFTAQFLDVFGWKSNDKPTVSISVICQYPNDSHLKLATTVANL